jgi:hypothetical protein
MNASNLVLLSAGIWDMMVSQLLCILGSWTMVYKFYLILRLIFSLDLLVP